jgi:hypothetical protein
MTPPLRRWPALCAALVLAATPAAARAAGRVRGLERPVARLRWNLPHDQRGQPGQVATRTCQVFARWAVLSSDEGEMGVDSGDAACWARTRAAFGLPARLPPPDCAAVLRIYPKLAAPAGGEEAGRLAQVAVHVRVRGLARTEATVLLDRPSCAPAP